LEIAMALPLAAEIFDELPRTPASEVKKQGWRGVMRTLSHHGKVLITNHNDPEAVILSLSEYTAMAEAARANTPTLETLRQQFDERLAALNADDAGDRLRALVGQPARLHGKVKAGSGY
jgi:PHD/YefM family antitoxin component YafN of YafNO toxin-antitoxin module